MAHLIRSTVLLLAFAGLAHAGTPLPDGPHIVVSADAKVSVKPDSARVRFDFRQTAAAEIAAKWAAAQRSQIAKKRVRHPGRGSD